MKNVTPVTPALATLLVAFVAAVSSTRSSDAVVLKEGRKFDRVFVDGKVRYFVDRSDGTIFGAKSDLAPNTDWYFGTTETVDKWSWDGFHGVPGADAGVVAVSTYGKDRKGDRPIYIRYRLASEVAAEAPVTTEATTEASSEAPVEVLVTA